MTPRIVVLAAPSGGGKTTIARALVAKRRDMAFSVSATTRPPRPAEKDGEAYHFLSRAEFARRREAGAFVEWAEYAGEWYGTLKAEVDGRLAAGTHVVLDIEIQGAAQVRRQYPPPRSIAIFVLPPSAAIWTERLIGRGTEARAAIARRAAQAIAEIRHSLDWEHIVINRDLDAAVAEVMTIVDEDGGRPHRPPPAEINRLVDELVRAAERLQHPG